MQRRSLALVFALVALAAASGCASSPPPAPPPPPAACVPHSGFELKVVSTSSSDEQVAAWSGGGALLEPAAWLGAADVERVDVVRDPEKPRDALSIHLREEARSRLERLTAEHVGRKVAIVIGGRIAATLTVRDPVKGPALLVTGGSDADVESMTKALCGA